jgi:hypothetical protein
MVWSDSLLRLDSGIVKAIVALDLVYQPLGKRAADATSMIS